MIEENKEQEMKQPLVAVVMEYLEVKMLFQTEWNKTWPMSSRCSTNYLSHKKWRKPTDFSMRLWH
jgi:hypothetical protein